MMKLGEECRGNRGLNNWCPTQVSCLAFWLRDLFLSFEINKSSSNGASSLIIDRHRDPSSVSYWLGKTDNVYVDAILAGECV